jgi:hypothetical protein
MTHQLNGCIRCIVVFCPPFSEIVIMRLAHLGPSCIALCRSTRSYRFGV